MNQDHLQEPAHPLAGLSGTAGRVVTPLNPDGFVLVEGLLVRARPAAGAVHVGADVRIQLANGQVIVSGPADPAAIPDAGATRHSEPARTEQNADGPGAGRRDTLRPGPARWLRRLRRNRRPS